jgi:hypothetical protein
MMNDRTSQLIRLLHLKKSIAYVGYDVLSLQHLIPLRNEVQLEIDYIIAQDKIKRLEGKDESGN